MALGLVDAIFRVYFKIVSTLCLSDFATCHTMHLLEPLRYLIGTTERYRPRQCLNQAARTIRLMLANAYLTPLGLHLRLETRRKITSAVLCLRPALKWESELEPPIPPQSRFLTFVTGAAEMCKMAAEEAALAAVASRQRHSAHCSVGPPAAGRKTAAVDHLAVPVIPAQAASPQAPETVLGHGVLCQSVTVLIPDLMPNCWPESKPSLPLLDDSALGRFDYDAEPLLPVDLVIGTDAMDLTLAEVYGLPDDTESDPGAWPHCWRMDLNVDGYIPDIDIDMSVLKL